MGTFIMKNFIKTFLGDTSGAAAAEYALILAVIGAGIVVGAQTLGTNISESLSAAGAYIKGQKIGTTTP